MKPILFDSPKPGSTDSQGPIDFANLAQRFVRGCGRTACLSRFLLTLLALGVGISVMSGCASGALSENEPVHVPGTGAMYPAAPAVQVASATTASAPVAQTSMVQANAEPSGALPASTEPVWQENFQQALARAAEHDMPVLVRFSATWCSPCRVMDTTVWPDEKVRATLANHAVPVEIDIDQQETADVVRRYGIRSVPTVLLVEPNGNELARGGFMSADALVDFLTQS